MRSIDRNLRDVRSVIDSREPVRVYSIGQLGDGNGNMYPDSSDLSLNYYRSGGRISVVTNVTVPPQHDLWVRVGKPYYEDTIQVIGAAGRQRGRVATLPPAGGFAPASYYMWGGEQYLTINERQLEWFRPTVNNGMTLYVADGIIDTVGGRRYIGAQSVSLASYVPATPDTAALVLVTLDVDGTLTLTDGADVTPISDLVAPAAPDSLLSNIPAAPSGTILEVCAVRVWRNISNIVQTSLVESTTNNDLIDLRAAWISANYTAAEILSLLLTVDGTGSGLDADMVDGSHASAFAATSHVHTLQALFTMEGNLAVGAKPIRIYNKYGSTKTISRVFLSANTAPTGAAIIVDVNKNGTTIFTTQSNRPQIAASANTGETTTINVSSFADGDYLTFDIDQVGSTVIGADLTVHVIYS